MEIKKVSIDTSAIFSLINNKDEHHLRAKEFYYTLKKDKSKVFTTNYITDETYTLLSRRINKSTALEFIEAMSKTFTIIYINKEDDLGAIEILKKFEDKGFSFTDAVSFYIMEKEKIKIAFAFDKHFIQAGLKTLP
ncbi:MAG: PIN domain-containing protein [bacterium]